ncbi:MAG TPA: SemiSWEET family transporter [Chitinophagaceae bacterium]|nr:SemiSWEET family transporter [Chitinophagaceae bacterium]
MNWIDIVGYSGSFLSSITFIPQVYKAWETKSVGDLSLATMLIVLTSTIIWLVYGIALNLWPVIMCNAVICLLSFILIYFKFSFRERH